MSIYENPDFSKIRKSSNGLTYRRVGDKVIVSRKIESNSSCTAQQLACRQSFSYYQQISSRLGPVIQAGFNGNTYNQRRLNFVKMNKVLYNFLCQNYPFPEGIPPLCWVLNALQSPSFQGEIYASSGSIGSQATFTLDQDGFPCGEIILSLPFKPGDQIEIVFCKIYEFIGEIEESIDNCSFLIGSDIVAGLEHDNALPFDHHLIPKLKTFMKLPYGAIFKGAFMAAVVHRGSTCSAAQFKIVTV